MVAHCWQFDPDVLAQDVISWADRPLWRLCPGSADGSRKICGDAVNGIRAGRQVNPDDQTRFVLQDRF
jgi:hypothetical protein